MATLRYHSAEMVRALPEDGNRYETVHGELLVTPAPGPWHQEIVERLNVALRLYLEREGVGHLFASPADISWGDDILVQPDLFVVPMSEARTLDWTRMRTLLLTVEISSPSTSRYDRFTKRRLYQELSVPVYWIVDPEQRAVEVWTPDLRFPHVPEEQISWNPPASTSPFRLRLNDLFRPI